MNKSEIEFEIKKALKVLKRKRGVFKENELAYLALTSKPGAINGDILLLRISLTTLLQSSAWE